MKINRQRDTRILSFLLSILMAVSPMNFSALAEEEPVISARITAGEETTPTSLDGDDAGTPGEGEDPAGDEAIAYMQIAMLDNIRVTVTADAGVISDGGQLTVSRTNNQATFTEDAEAVLGIEKNDRTIIRHMLISFSGTEINGSAQVEMDHPDPAEMLKLHPEGEASVYVLKCREAGQTPEDRVKRVSSGMDMDQGTLRFTLSETGVYDIGTVLRLPAEETEEETGEGADSEPAGQAENDPGTESREQTEVQDEDNIDGETGETGETGENEETGETGETGETAELPVTPSDDGASGETGNGGKAG